jgi:PPOX class probable F420-dependent enzyme
MTQISWDHAERSLRNASSYWLCTTRADGRPHAMPVWGLWRDGALWFGTGRTSIKGRNIARDPRVVVHLESGDDVVILEGTVEERWDPEVVTAYAEKYAMAADELRFEESPSGGGIYYLAPERAQLWIEALFVESAIRFRFDEDGRPVPDGRPTMAAAEAGSA